MPRPRLKKLLPKSRRARLLVAVISTALIALAADMSLVQLWRHIPVSPETTVLTAPLDHAGFPNYAAALMLRESRDVTDDNNAAALLMQFVNTQGLSFDWGDLKTPSLDQIPPHLSRLVSLENWRRAVAGNNDPVWDKDGTLEQARRAEEDAMSREPWRAVEHPEWKQWLEAQADALEEAHRAVQRPRCCFPQARILGDSESSPGSLLGLLLPDVGGLNSLAKALMADAMERAGRGDYAGFRRDAIDVMKLARLLHQSFAAPRAIFSLKMEEMALHAVAIAARDPAFSSSQEAAILLREIEAIPPPPSVADSLSMGERWFVLDLICYADFYGLGTRVPHLNQKATQPTVQSRLYNLLRPIHYAAILRETNSFFDRVAVAATLPTHARRLAALQSLDAEYSSLKFKWIEDQLLPPGDPFDGHYAGQERLREYVVLARDAAIVALRAAPATAHR